MFKRICGCLLAVSLIMAAGAAGQTPEESLLSRFREKIRQDLTAIGNYTCLETVRRTRRAPPANDFRPVDTVRLEVSTVGGKELFAKPGGRFDDRDVQALVGSGVIGSGMFSQFVGNLFIGGKGALKYAREENVAGRRGVRYDFRMTQQESGFRLQFFNVSEMVAAKGSFWFDPATLDLLRLEIHGKDIPFNLHQQEAVVRIDYARMRLGNSDSLLPKRSEVTITYLSGDTNRNVIEFSQCHAYSSESTIAFEGDHDAPAPAAAQVPQPQATPEPTPQEAAAPAANEPAPIASPAVVVPPPAPTPAPTPEPARSREEAQAPPPSPKSESPQVVLRDEPVSFKSEVNLVMVPVVVRDRAGRAVAGLRKEDFRLFDANHRQEIAHFAVQNAEAAPPGSSGRTSPGEKPVTPEPDHFVAYVFDDIDLKFEDLASVRDAAWRSISESLRQSARIAVVATSGRTLLDFTDDRTKVHDALYQLRPNSIYRPTTRECPDLSFYEAYAIEKGMGGGARLTMSNPDANPGDPVAPGSAAGQLLTVAIQDLENCNPAFDPRNRAPDPVAESLEVELAARRVVSWRQREVDVVLNSLKLLSKRMAPFEGQRTVILVSPGFLMTDALDRRATELIDEAIRAGVTISTLDALGLSAMNPAGEIDQAVRPGAPHPNLLQAKVPFRKAEYAAGAQALAALAEGTGGKSIENTNDFLGAYRRLTSVPEFVYVLGFTPRDTKANGNFHPVKVKLAGGRKYEVQSRRGYFAPRRGEPVVPDAEREMRDAVSSRAEIHTLPVEVSTLLDGSNPADVRLTVMVSIDRKQLKQRHQSTAGNGRLTAVVSLFDANGDFISGNRKEMKLQPGEDAPLLLKAVFGVKPGAYRVRVVVRDEAEQILDARNQAVAIP